MATNTLRVCSGIVEATPLRHKWFPSPKCSSISRGSILPCRQFSSTRRAAATVTSTSKASETPSKPTYTPRTSSYKPTTTTKSSYTPSSSSTSTSSPSTSTTSASTPTNSSSAPETQPLHDLSSGLADEPLILDEGERQVDWTRSYHGLSARPFSKEAADILLAPIPFDDVEVKPDGIIYLPEIKYRRILNKAFGPGAWGLAPRGETIVTGKSVTREYALLAHGRLVSVARGEQDYFSPEGIPTATEGCKSNALMRCCKDLGVASELWDPRYIRKFMKEYAKQVWAEHMVTKKKKQLWLRKDDELRYPFKESKFGS